MNHWLTFGMSNYQTSGFSDTSRHMTHAFAGRRHYVEPPKPITAWKRLDGHVVRWDYESIEDVNRLIPPLPIPSRLDKFGVGAALQAKQLDRVLSTIIGTAWRENTVAYVTNWTPQFQPLIEKLAPKFLVFDIVDDVLSFPYRMNKERTEAAWSKLAAQANLVVAVSETLQQDAIRRWQRPVQVLSNAVDADHFSTPSRNVPKGVQHSPVPRVGFAGSINHWLDYELILHMVRAHRGVCWYFAGRRGHFGDVATQRAHDAVFAEPNVHYVGELSYHELPGFLHAMDVLWLPRKANRASAASSPLKLFEYLAVGKPIVALGVPVPKDVERLIYHVEHPTLENFEDCFQHAMAEYKGESPSLWESRRHAAGQRTWKQRVEAVIDALMT